MWSLTLTLVMFREVQVAVLWEYSVAYYCGIQCKHKEKPIFG